MGYLLFVCGIGLIEFKVEVVVNVREFEFVVEVRSFMGFVNFSVKFILNLVIVLELFW